MHACTEFGWAIALFIPIFLAKLKFCAALGWLDFIYVVNQNQINQPNIKLLFSGAFSIVEEGQGEKPSYPEC